MLREAHAIWKDGPYAGEGVLSTPSGVLKNAKYTFGLQTGLQAHTSPCEMLAAAVASCMSRMVALEMARVGIKPAQVETDATFSLEFVGESVQVSGVQLKITARTSDSEYSRFEEAIESARRECPISSLLNVDIQCDAKVIPTTASALV